MKKAAVLEAMVNRCDWGVYSVIHFLPDEADFTLCQQRRRIKREMKVDDPTHYVL